MEDVDLDVRVKFGDWRSTKNRVNRLQTDTSRDFGASGQYSFPIWSRPEVINDGTSGMALQKVEVSLNVEAKFDS